MSLILVEDLCSYSSSLLLSCELSDEYLENSYLFLVPTKISDFIDKVRSLNLQHTLSLICYDKGSMQSSSRAYWALKAVGYLNIKILYGGLKACIDNSLILTTHAPAELPYTSKLLSFNSSMLLTKQEFSDYDVKPFHVIFSGQSPALLYDYSPTCQKGELIAYMELQGVTVNPRKRNVIYGDLSGLIGVIMEFIGISNILVVLDDFDANTFKKSLVQTPNSSTVYVSLTENEIMRSNVKMNELGISIVSADQHYSSSSRKENSRSRKQTGSTFCNKCNLL